MSTTNILDLNNRIDKLADSYPADNVMMSDGVTSVENALNGFKFYPTGTSIVGLVSNDSPYTDSDGNYILADSTTGQSMIDGVTYKSIASTEDTRGMVGADSVIPFRKAEQKVHGFAIDCLSPYTSASIRFIVNSDGTVVSNYADSDFITAFSYNSSTKQASATFNQNGKLYANYSSVNNYINIVAGTSVVIYSATSSDIYVGFIFIND